MLMCTVVSDSIDGGIAAKVNIYSPPLIKFEELVVSYLLCQLQSSSEDVPSAWAASEVLGF